MASAAPAKWGVLLVVAIIALQSAGAAARVLLEPAQPTEPKPAKESEGPKHPLWAADSGDRRRLLLGRALLEDPKTPNEPKEHRSSFELKWPGDKEEEEEKDGGKRRALLEDPKTPNEPKEHRSSFELKWPGEKEEEEKDDKKDRRLLARI